jgi:hypothetical protein
LFTGKGAYGFLTVKLPRLGINMRLAAWMAGLAVDIGLIGCLGASFSSLEEVCLGYRIIRLVIRLIGQVFSLLFTVVSTLVLIATILLIRI